MTNNPQQRVLTAEERSHIYWFLADSFSKAPTQELLETWQALETSTEAFNLVELQQEYMTLIAGIKEGYGLTPPYESLYRQDIFPTEIRTAVLSYFKAAGIDADSVCEQSPDFLSSELKLLSLLAYYQHQAELEGNTEQSESLNEMQQAFLKHHLLVWLPEYCQQLCQQSKTEFYKHLGIYMQTFVASHR